MTLDHASVVEKKAKLQQAIRVLKKLRGFSLDQISYDEITEGSVMHYLTVGIEAILDIGSHILTEDFSASPETYEDVIVQLGRQHIISGELTKVSAGMGKFRNKLIHEYSDINISKVYNYLQIAPDQFDQFDQAFSLYLKAKKTGV